MIIKWAPLSHLIIIECYQNCIIHPRDSNNTSGSSTSFSQNFGVLIFIVLFPQHLELIISMLVYIYTHTVSIKTPETWQFRMRNFSDFSMHGSSHMCYHSWTSKLHILGSFLIHMRVLWQVSQSVAHIIIKLSCPNSIQHCAQLDLFLLTNEVRFIQHIRTTLIRSAFS